MSSHLFKSANNSNRNYPNPYPKKQWDNQVKHVRERIFAFPFDSFIACKIILYYQLC